jgi:hypothetical protein
MSLSKPTVADRLAKLSPRVVLIIPCLMPALMGNEGGVGLTGIGLGTILASNEYFHINEY